MLDTLEPLVPSKTRRSLLHYLLSHPASRFYLRGLAKELGLTITPLRLELKRLERLGVLRAYPEANVRFYVVDQHSPLFAQLTQAVKDPSTLVTAAVLSAPAIPEAQRARRVPIRWPSVVGVASVVLVVAALLGSAIYLTSTNRRLAIITNEVMTAQRSPVVLVQEKPNASAGTDATPAAAQVGIIRSVRWRLSPGAVGGFNPGDHQQSY